MQIIETPQKLLSIIIPAYNMEKYLSRCMESLVSAKAVLPLIEILIINDGSKDATLNIAHGYQNLYPQSVLAIDKENGNYGSCVNRGLKEATGKYIKVLDADDYFLTQNIERLINALKTFDVDLILTDYDVVNPLGKVIKMKKFDFPQNEVLDIEHYCNCQKFEKVQMHAVTYRTDLLKTINYYQSEGISYTDQEWIFEPMAHVKSFCYTGIVLYQYLLGREGQTMSETQRRKYISHQLKGLCAQINAYGRNVSICNENMKQYMLAKMIQRIHSIYFKTLFMKCLDIKSLIELDEFIRTKNAELFLASENVVIHRFIPFHYIRWWRMHKTKEFPQWIVNSVVVLAKIAKSPS